MPTIKSRNFECPSTVTAALANLGLVGSNIKLLSNRLIHQRSLLDDDVVTAILDVTVEEIDTYIEEINLQHDAILQFFESF